MFLILLKMQEIIIELDNTKRGIPSQDAKVDHNISHHDWK